MNIVYATHPNLNDGVETRFDGISLTVREVAPSQ